MIITVIYRYKLVIRVLSSDMRNKNNQNGNNIIIRIKKNK